MKTNCMDCEYKHFFMGNNCNDALECRHPDAQFQNDECDEYHDFRHIISLGRTTPKQFTPPEWCPFNNESESNV